MVDFARKPLPKRFPLWVIPWVLVIVSLACSMPGIGVRTPTPGSTPTQPPATVGPTATPRPLPPSLVESQPAEGVEIPLDGSITLYFNQPMDRESVQAALMGQPGVKGQWAWSDEATLVFTPETALPPGTELTVLLQEGRAANGLAMTEPISLTYRTVGDLLLTQSLPAPDTQEVDPSSAVVAAFNRPVVPLAADPANLPAAFSIDPPAEGRGEWINTSTYIFYPAPSLQGGKPHQVTINPDLRGLDGSRLTDAPSWSFTTALPELTVGEPAYNAQEVRLDAPIRFQFNQPMDKASVEANFSLTALDGVPVPGSFEWDELSTTFTFTPTNLLTRGFTYTAQVAANGQAQGGTPLGKSFGVVFTTVMNLAVKSSEPAPFETLPAYQGVHLVFTAPLTDDDPLPWITITPAVANLDTNWWAQGGQELYLYGDFAPSTTYTLTLSPGLPDAWGQPMGQPYSLSFQTAPLSASLTIATGTNEIFLTPQDSGITGQITNLDRLPLAVGPISLEDWLKMLGSDGYNFMQSYQPQPLQRWEQSLSLPPNQSQAVNIPLTPDGSALAPGLYWLKFDLTLNGSYAGPYLLVVSNAHLTYKVSPTDALVWAVDLRTRQPIPNAPVRIVSQNGTVLAEGSTDAQGLFKSDIPEQADPYTLSYAILGQPGQENFTLTSSNWAYGLSAWDFGLSSGNTAPRLMAYLYTDRPIYRPGQTVYFRAVARKASNGRYSLPEIDSLPLALSNGNGEKIANFDLSLSAFGTGHDEFQLPLEAAPGYYSFYSEAAEAYLTFQVANYRKPEINLQVAFSPNDPLPGETLKAQVNARYFFDAPAGNTAVRWALYAAADPIQLPGYQVGPTDTRWVNFYYFPDFSDPLGALVQEGNAQTRPDGTLDLELASDLESLRDRDGNLTTSLQYSRRRYTLEVTATDESGLPVSARAQVWMDPADFYVGLRPDVWIGQAGQALGFDLLAAQADGSGAGERALRAEFEKVTWERQPIPANSRTTIPEMKAVYTPVASVDLMTNPEGLARLSFIPPDPGSYQLKVYSTEAGQENILTEMIVWVGGAGQAVWPSLPNARLRLTADRAPGAQYRAGETAQVFIPNPYGSGTQALVTFERGSIQEQQILTLNESGFNLSIPLSEEDAPNLFVSVTLMGSNADGLADFRQGYIELLVEPSALELNVQVATEPTTAGPGDEVQLEITVTDANGNPVQGEFSLAVLDLAALALADPNAPDIVPAFYAAQPLGVRTGLALAIYAARSANLPEGRGGGGGAGDEVLVRENFPDTAYWNAEVVTDAQGKGRVSVTLPDSLTTWQVDVRGVTTDSKVGQARAEVVTTQELLVRPVLPRFLVAGDHALLAAVVQNNTDQELETQVALEASGFSLDEGTPATRSVTIPANGRSRLEWWGTAQEVDSLDLIFSAQAGDRRDLVRPANGKLPVLRYRAPQTYRTAGVLDSPGEQLELVSLPRSFDPSGGKLSLELAPSLAAAMMKALDTLDHSEYESTELTLSRFLPNLEAYRALQEFGAPSPTLESRLERLTTQGLRRLEARQNEQDGGWSWWEGDTSDPYITAYIVYGLKRAQEAGFDLDSEGLQAAIAYLKDKSGQVADQTDPSVLDRLAFQHFALSMVGEPQTDSLEALYQSRDLLDPWAQALLALALEKAQPGSEASRALISDLEAQAIRSAAGAHWEMHTFQGYNLLNNVGNSAMVIFALAQRDPGSPLLADAVRYQMAARHANGTWASSYATAWSVMALTEAMRGTGEMGGSFAFSASLNGVPFANSQGSSAEALTPVVADAPLASLYPDEPNALVIERQEGQGRLYYSATLEVFQKVESVSALNRGIEVTRSYWPSRLDCPEDDCAPLNSAQAGKTVQVRLTLTLPQEAHYLAVEDVIPAGAEIIDASLKTTEQGQPDQPIDPFPWNPRRPFDSGWGWWLFQRPQIYDDHIAWAASYLPAGTYELTYSLALRYPGTFQAIPARAWMLYFPEVQGNSTGAVFEITP